MVFQSRQAEPLHHRRDDGTPFAPADMPADAAGDIFGRRQIGE